MRDGDREPAGALIFDTAIGAVGVAWTTRGLVALALPAASREATRARLAEISAPLGEDLDPPAWVIDAAARITAHLEGRVVDLASLPLDLDHASRFSRGVYAITRAIPRGEVRTYVEVARAAGAPGAARAVGRAMADNPLPIVIPCHRVIASGDGPGGFSAPGGLDTKARLLAIEGHLLAGTEQLHLSFRDTPRSN